MPEEILLDAQPREEGTKQLGFTSKVLDTGISAGIQLVTLNCGPLRVVVMPTRGMGILRVYHQSMEQPFGWDSPIIDPVHPQWVPVSEPSGLGWLDGFNELLVRCGLESNGAPQHSENGCLEYPLHGRIANLPASSTTILLDKEAGTIQLTGCVYETRFHFRRLCLQSSITCSLDHPNEIRIHDQVQNLGNRPADFQLLYHINIGSPTLEKDSRIVAPFQTICPRDATATCGIDQWEQYLGPTHGSEEQVYFMKMASDQNHQTKTLLHNAAGDRGVSVGYRTDQLPCFSLWKNTVGAKDGYVTGLEPGVNFPNRRKFEEQQGRVIPLASEESKAFDLTLAFLTSAREVKSVNEHILQLTPDSSEVVREPVPEMCE